MVRASSCPPPPPPHPHHTNVCKISRLWGAISSLFFNKSLSNLAILCILRRSSVALSSGIDGFSPRPSQKVKKKKKRKKKKRKRGRVPSLKHQYNYDYKYMLWTCFRPIFLFLHRKLVYIYSRERHLRLILIEEKKLIGQCTRLRENEDLPIWEAQASRQKPPSFYVRALITRDIVHRKDAQCNAKEYP